MKPTRLPLEVSAATPCAAPRWDPSVLPRAPISDVSESLMPDTSAEMAVTDCLEISGIGLTGGSAQADVPGIQASDTSDIGAQTIAATRSSPIVSLPHLLRRRLGKRHCLSTKITIETDCRT